MIFGKINPVVSIVTNPTPFAQTTVTGSYMVIAATPYILGSTNVNFQINYGNCTFDEAGEVTDFRFIYSNRIEVSGETIQNWGTDDIAMLNAIATLQGTTVTEIVSGSVRMPF